MEVRNLCELPGKLFISFHGGCSILSTHPLSETGAYGGPLAIIIIKMERQNICGSG